jgi:hypothetical protein
MGHSVTITTPFPTTEEVAKRMGLGKDELRMIQDLVDRTLDRERRRAGSNGNSAGTGRARPSRGKTAR